MPCLPAPSLSTNLLAHYPLDGTPNDAAGSNNGTAFGGLLYTTDRTGAASKAANFDGLNDSITTANAIAERSVAFWFRANAAAQMPIFQGGNMSAQTGAGYFIGTYQPGGVPAVTWDTTYGVVVDFVNRGVYIPFQNIVTGWHHIAVSWDGSSPNIKVAIDGELLPGYLYNTSTGGFAANLSSQPFSMGSAPSPNAAAKTRFGVNFNTRLWGIGLDKMNGRLDEVRIYARALTDDEMRLLAEVYATASPAVVCSTQTVTLTSPIASATSYTWKNLTTGATIGTTQTVMSSVSATTSFALEAVLPGCTFRDTVKVTRPPAISITPFSMLNLTGSFTLSGGLPQTNASNYTSVTMALQGNPAVTATLTTAPFTHNETVSFTCLQAGTYTVVATDAGGCSGTGSITISAAQNCAAPNMVAVEGGTFTMGCTAEQEPDCTINEKPAHEVTLSDFEMGKYEVTQGEWQALMGSNPSAFATCGTNCPVEQVSWFDAAVYCNRLSECLGFTPCYYADAAFTQVYGKNGSTWSLPNGGAVHWKQNDNGYRLPTEAEWEYAARGGEKSKGYKYSGSNNAVLVAWYGAGLTHLSGTKAANEIGFHDLSGNVSELCYDWWDSNYYANSPACTPIGPMIGVVSMIRGGSWIVNSFDVRATSRNAVPPNNRHFGHGFRLARTPIPSPPPCVTALTHPTNGATSVALTTAIEWVKVPTATGYRLSLGTAPGGTQLLNNQDLGDTTRYNPVGCLPQNTTLHVSLTPYNADGSATGCTGFSFTTGSGVPEMVLVPGGTIKLGGQPPATLVTIDSFLIGRYEVTQCEWVSLMGNNPSAFTGCGEDCPVERVSWYDAAVYCNRLSVQQGFTPCYYSDAAYTQIYGWNGSAWMLPNSGTVYWQQNAKGFGLPTEAEWEYMGRGAPYTKGFIYSGSDSIALVAWYNGNSGPLPTTHSVGLKQANELHIRDVSGNVYEWTWDWWGNVIIPFPTGGNNPTGATSGTMRIIRGGGWGNSASVGCRVADRFYFSPDYRRSDIGFRLARKP